MSNTICRSLTNLSADILYNFLLILCHLLDVDHDIDVYRWQTLDDSGIDFYRRE